SWTQLSWHQRLLLFAVTAIPGALVIAGQALANWYYTGETAAAGALVKLEMNHPHLSKEQVWDAWVFHLKYQVLRVTDYHLSDTAWSVGQVRLSSGWLMWLMALVPLTF